MDRLIREQDVLDVINEAIRIGRFYAVRDKIFLFFCKNVNFATKHNKKFFAYEA